MYLKLFICSIFAATSAFGAGTTTAAGENGLDGNATKQITSGLVKLAGELNSAKTLKGYLAGLKKKATPEIVSEVSKLYTDGGAELSDKIPNCSVKGLTITCGKMILEVIGQNTIKINGQHEYTVNTEKNIAMVTREIMELNRPNSKGGKLIDLLITPAYADGFFGEGGFSWGSAAVGAGVVGILWWLMSGNKKEEPKQVTVHHNYYYGGGPNGPVPVMAAPASKSLKKDVKKQEHSTR